MRKYTFPVEIHTHTEHSDAHFTTSELIDASKEFGYAGIILTDHNSSSGYNEMLEQKLIPQEDFLVIKGMEWTTYFGHMLVHHADYDVDWREATADTIDTYIQEVKHANGLVGIAHPFDMGSPICTGCHWEFNVKDYNNVDYIEIWNSNHPHLKPESRAAYDMWLQKLDEGYRISASSGRDWHREDEPGMIIGVTYLEIGEEALTEENFILALENGYFYISLGPLCSFKIKDKDEIIYQLGDTVSVSNHPLTSFEATIAPAELEWFKQNRLEDVQFTLYNNRKIIYQKKIPGVFTGALDIGAEFSKSLEQGYLRYEVMGKLNEEEEVKLIISNPIYLVF